MAAVKWIKLSVGMFNNPKIMYIRSLPTGSEMILVWVMLLTKAGACNNNGFIVLTDRIAYTSEMLANEFSMDLNIVRLALQTFESLDMISVDNAIHITGWSEHQNLEGLDKIREQAKLRKRNQRDREKQQLLCHETSHVTDTHGHDTDIDKDIDKELEREEDKEKIKEIINYLNQMCGTSYKTATQTTRKLIVARMNEGFTVEDFKTVVRKKHVEWSRNNEMAKYLRPNTLFGTKFESYLNQIEAPRTTVEGHELRDDQEIPF